MRIAFVTMRISFNLTRKQVQVVNRCLQQLFSAQAMEPMTLARMRELKFPQALSRRVKVTAKGAELLLTDSGMAALERTVDTLSEASAGQEAWTRSDVWDAVREVYEACWRNRQEPESVQELVDLVAARIGAKVKKHTFVAALYGVKLSGIDEVKLGELRLVSSVKSLVQESAVLNEEGLEKGFAKDLLQVPCLAGSKAGTFEAAKRWYREQVHLAAGMLAVEAGASYERAATSFCIEPAFERASAASGSGYLFWNDIERYLGRSISPGRGQPFELTAQRAGELAQPGAFDHAFQILQKRDRTELEDAIARAVYWYGDAHRDPVRVMQFVKYWSCLECLLGGPGEQLTETLAVGVATVLTYGHFRLFEAADYSQNSRTVKRLYAARSKAVHRASHSHVTFQDVSLLSGWTAWVIYNAVSFSHAGMDSTKTLWRNVQRVAAPTAER